MVMNDLFEKLNITKRKYIKYLTVIQDMYNHIAYHNKTHATDVCQTMYFYVNHCDFWKLGSMTDLELAVSIISCLVHDTDHGGFNNPFMVATWDKLALRYNDWSVLENHHIAIAFDTMLKDPETCIYDNFDNDQFKGLRSMMIDQVLATDMAFHFKDLEQFRAWISSPDFDYSKGGDKKI